MAKLLYQNLIEILVNKGRVLDDLTIFTKRSCFVDHMFNEGYHAVSLSSSSRQEYWLKIRHLSSPQGHLKVMFRSVANSNDSLNS